MFTKQYFVVLLLAYVANCEDAYLPPYITPCEFKSDDFVDCIKKQIEIALPQFTHGIPEMDVPSIDPVHLKNIEIVGNGLNLTFSEAEMHGLSQSKVTELKLQLSKGEGQFSLSFKGNMNLTAKYVADGRILILPIQGNGDALVDAQGVEVHIDSKLILEKDSKGDHMKLATPKYRYTIERTVFDLKNLFNGNKQLADTTLQFANENWQQLMDELSPPAIKQIVKTVVKAINKFLSKVDIHQIIKGYTED